jgi:hypothetical protein
MQKPLTLVVERILGSSGPPVLTRPDVTFLDPALADHILIRQFVDSESKATPDPYAVHFEEWPIPSFQRDKRQLFLDMILSQVFAPA